jgi:hypothetical protein
MQTNPSKCRLSRGKTHVLVTCALMMALTGCCSRGLLPTRDLVPDGDTAIAIAYALIKAHYGEEELKGELPLTATLSNGVWIVKGTLPKGWVGGVAVVKISKADARIHQLNKN